MNNYPQREVLNPVFPNNVKPYRLGLTGHRPKKLGNVYDLNDPRWQNFMQDLNQVLEQRIQEYGYVECHSGMALGADMAWALVIQSARERYPGQVKFVADIPNPDQPAKWTSPETVALFYDLVDNADERVTYAPTYTKECLNDRNIGMIDHSDEVIALWDGTASGTGHAVAYAESLNKFIKVLHPEQYGFEVKRDPRTPVVDNTQNYNHPNGNNFGNNYGQGNNGYNRGNNGYNGGGNNYNRGNNGYYNRGNNSYNGNNGANNDNNYNRGNNGNNYNSDNNGYNGANNPTNQSDPNQSDPNQQANSFRSGNGPKKPDTPEMSKQANGLMNMEPSSYIYDKRTVKDLEEVEQKAAPTKSPQTKAPSAPQTQAPSYDAMMSQVQEEQVDLGANIVENAPEFNDHDIPDPSMDMMGM